MLHGTVYDSSMAERRRSYGSGSSGKARWNAERLHALRTQLGLTQQQLANELGVRQQTVSEWETGAYEPRGASTRLISIVAERAGFTYGSQPETADRSDHEESGE
jgi:DNA-binding transcriptional regulator YiaG